MKVISALGSQIVQDKIKENNKDIEFLFDDFNYQQGVMDALRKSDPDALIISENIEGEFNRNRFIESIREASETVKIILIIEKDDNEYQNWLASKGVYSVFVDGKCTFDDIYESLLREDSVFFKTETKREVIEKERVVVKEKVIKEIVPVKFKKLVLTVFGCSEFACEFSYLAAKNTGLSVLIIDADTLNATLDVVLNIPKYPEGVRAFDMIENNTGLNICLDAISKNQYNSSVLSESAIRKKGVENLYVLTGNYSLENFEYYNVSSFEQLLKEAYQLFDLTVVLTNRFVYDAFTLTALKASDYNIIPIQADRIKLREINRILKYLHDKQDMPLEKHKFVSFEYDTRYDLHREVVYEIVEGNLLGNIGSELKRRIYRNKKVPYAKNMSERNRLEYTDILAFFNIVPKRTIKDRVKDSVTYYMRKLNPTFD